MQEVRKCTGNYTICVRALKLTSLSIGGQKLSEAAAGLEQAGKPGWTDISKSGFFAAFAGKSGEDNKYAG